MNWHLILWVSVNTLAALYSLFLMRRGLSYVTNIGPLFESLEQKAKEVKTQQELERLQSIFLAAKKTGNIGVIYSVLGLVGMSGVVVLNLLLVLS